MRNSSDIAYEIQLRIDKLNEIISEATEQGEHDLTLTLTARATELNSLLFWIKTGVSYDNEETPMPKSDKAIYAMFPVEMFRGAPENSKRANCEFCHTLCYYDPKALKYVLEQKSDMVHLLCVNCGIKSGKINVQTVKDSVELLLKTRGSEDEEVSDK